MRSPIRALAALLLLVATPALACGLDDCTLSGHAHSVGGESHDDAFSWMNHDLASARHAAGRGDRARTLDTARALDHAMRSQLDALVQTRGAASVEAMHDALQDLVRSLDGTPLPALVVPHSDALAAR